MEEFSTERDHDFVRVYDSNGMDSFTNAQIWQYWYYLHFKVADFIGNIGMKMKEV